MKYISTRGDGEKVESAEAIIRGIASDGGLFVPTELPKVELHSIEALAELSYQARAEMILGKFLTDYTGGELKTCIEEAYGGDKFDSPRVAPVVRLGDRYVLELWHGPTSAFKDMALQLLPRLLRAALKKTGETSDIAILVATSGDTGKAALEGFKDVAKTRIAVFYPKEGVSRMQELQMITQTGQNAQVIAVEGNFDDAQSGVKQIFGDADLNAALRQKAIRLSSANSINWGRLAPQIVYYFSAYADMVRAGNIESGDAVHFVVPTGNFGNILAGYYAKRMGLPIGKLICASNKNNVLTEFLRTGVYDRNRALYQTISPSMDILISSNLERLLYHIGGGDTQKISAWMNELSAKGRYAADAAYLEKIQETFWADWTDDDAALDEIRSVYEAHNYVIDTHTAVAWRAADRYQNATGDQTPLAVVSTASPYKFNQSVLRALGKSADGDEFAMLDALAKINPAKIPAGLQNLRAAKVVHTKQCAKEQMKELVRQF